MTTEMDVLSPTQNGNVEAQGSVAYKLLNNGGNLDALRTNTVLRDEEWEEIDDTVITVAQERLNFVRDMIARGQTFNLNNPLGTLVVEHERVSEMTAAELSMDGVTRDNNDRVTFDQVQTPVPIIHKQFQITVRNLESSRRRGDMLDTTQVRTATRQVNETIEDIHINGTSNTTRLKYDNKTATLNGLRDFGDRNTVTKTGNWADSAVSGKDILDDVRAMIDAAQQANHFGRFNLYVPQNWWIPLLEDFKAESDKTILQRILELPPINKVEVADKLPDSEAVMVELSSETFDVIRGFDPRTVEWESGDGMVFNFVVMAMLVPRPKSDKNGNSGIVHLS